MPGKRSRLGCDECRGRRRKCDEKKPICGDCHLGSRTCTYSLKVIWDAGRKQRPRRAPSAKTSTKRCPVPDQQPMPLQFVVDRDHGHDSTTRHRQADSAPSIAPASDHAIVAASPASPAESDDADRSDSALIRSPRSKNDSRTTVDAFGKVAFRLPRSLPNGVPLSPRYHRLLSYFTHDILASLSCHPSVHDDLCRGLIPVTFHSPQLLSACLALSAAGFMSRGLIEVDGIGVPRILEHLQSSGLSLLRTALEAGKMDETLLATCLIWCLADVFTYRQGSTSWRIHLQGIKALLDGSQAHRYFATESNSKAAQSAMRHLYLLYLSLQTLPHAPALLETDALDESPDPSTAVTTTAPMTTTIRAFPQPSAEDHLTWDFAFGSKIDGFLGYSEELLHVLQEVNRLSRLEDTMGDRHMAEADILLGRVNAMISRDTQAPPGVSIVSSLSPEYNREFALCHKTFQQATLVHLYRRLYHLPSNSDHIQAAVDRISEMICNMTQGQPCHTWVAMAMPLFTMGCEAFTDEQQAFALDKVHKLEVCIGSFHVRTIRQALQDIWRIRREAGDVDGNMCASSLLDQIQYNIILF